LEEIPNQVNQDESSLAPQLWALAAVQADNPLLAVKSPRLQPSTEPSPDAQSSKITVLSADQLQNIEPASGDKKDTASATSRGFGFVTEAPSLLSVNNAGDRESARVSLPPEQIIATGPKTLLARPSYVEYLKGTLTAGPSGTLPSKKIPGPPPPIDDGDLKPVAYSERESVMGRLTKGYIVGEITGKSLLANDDVGDGLKSINMIGGLIGKYGTLTVNADGTYHYSLNAPKGSIRANETDDFAYTIADKDGDTSNQALLKIKVLSDGSWSFDDTAPKAVDKSGGESVGESVVTGNIITGQVTGGNGPLTLKTIYYLAIKYEFLDQDTLTIATEHGTFTVSRFGEYQYKGSDDRTGDDIVSFEVQDIDGDIAAAQVLFKAHDSSPSAKDDSLLLGANDTVKEGNLIIGSDTNGDGITRLTRVGGQALQNGMVVINGTGYELTVYEDGRYRLVVPGALPNAINLSYEISDRDQDTATAQIKIEKVAGNDGIPTLLAHGFNVDETSLKDGPITINGKLTADYGPDGPGKISITGYGALGSIKDNLLSSGGAPVLLSQVGSTVFGYAGAALAFQIDVRNDGTYTFKQHLPLAHAAGNAANDIINLTLDLIIEDADGDRAANKMTIGALDDAPTALANLVTVAASSIYQGNAMTNDILSVDGGHRVASVAFGDQIVLLPVDGSMVTINGAFGRLTINQTGVYEYQAPQAAAGSKDTFRYTLVDGDGDSSSADLAVTVTGAGENLDKLNNVLNGMNQGSWLKIPSANGFFDVAYTKAQHDAVVAATGSADFWGNVGVRSVLTAWNSAAYDPAENKMYFFGGGHADYGGNEVYEYDLRTLAWTRLTDPAPLTKADVMPNGQNFYVPENTPVSVHTYDSMLWNPATKSMWLIGQRIAYQKVGSPFDPTEKIAWEFNPRTKEWTAHKISENPKEAATTYIDKLGVMAAIDNHVNGNRDFYIYDNDGNEKHLGKIQGLNDSVIGTMFDNPETGDVYAAYGSRLYRIDITDTSATAVPIATLPLIEQTNVNVSYYQCGFQYNSNDKMFYCWNGGRELVRWNPTDNSFSVLWNENSELAPIWNTTGVVFDKFTYVQESNAFVGITNGGDGMWVYKPGENSTLTFQAFTDEIVIDGATTESISLLLPLLGGDKDYDANVTVLFREVGSNEWHDGMDMFRLRPELVTIGGGRTLDKSPEGFASTLFGLKPGTDYEIKVQVNDPDGLQNPLYATQTFTTSTKEIPQELPDQPNIINVTNSLELKAAIANAKPGDVITLQAGTYDANIFVNKGGTADNPVVIRGVDIESVIIDGNGAAANGIQINANYVHVENMTITQTTSGISFGKSTDGVVIRDNYIHDVQYGIVAKGGHENLYIANNVLAGTVVFPDISQATWSKEGIVVTGHNIEVANNTLSGFGDSMGMHHQTSIENISVNFHHNEVLWGGDDGVELDFGLRNIQAHHNMISNVSNGVSFQPVWGGPAYAYQNVIFNSANGPYKLKPEVDNTSGIFILNNTSIVGGNGANWSNTSGLTSLLTVKNNLFIAEGDYVYTLSNQAQHRMVDFSNNAWSSDGYFNLGSKIDVRSFAQWAASTYGKNDVLLDGQKIFSSLDPKLETDEFNVYRTAQGADFSLDAQSRAIDAGVIIKNVNDGYNGGAPDIGAWESGAGKVQYGSTIPIGHNIYQPLDMAIARAVADQAISLQTTDLDKAIGNFLVMTANPEPIADVTTPPTLTANGFVTDKMPGALPPSEILD
jgi:VCBS repeat-containing protein